MVNFESVNGVEEIKRSENGKGFMLKLRREEADILPQYLCDFNLGVSFVKIERRFDREVIAKFQRFFNERMDRILSRFKAMGKKGLKSVFTKGTRWALDTALGSENDMEVSEHRGVFPFADPSTIEYGSFEKALNFMRNFEDVKMDFCDDDGNLTILITCGGSEFSKEMVSTIREVPYLSDSGRKYYGLLGCLANYAWARRQIVTGIVEMAAQDAFGKSTMARKLVDVSFNLLFDDGRFLFYKHDFPVCENASLEYDKNGLLLKLGSQVHRMVCADV